MSKKLVAYEIIENKSELNLDDLDDLDSLSDNNDSDKDDDDNDSNNNLLSGLKIKDTLPK